LSEPAVHPVPERVPRPVRRPGPGPGIVAIVLACGLAAGPAAAQDVLGRVVEDGSGAPVAGARVALVDTLGVVRAETVSDAEGRFAVGARRGGAVAIRVDRLGYATWVSPYVELERGETLQVEIRVGADAIPLEPLVVTAFVRPAGGRAGEFHQRRLDPARSGGFFLTRREIDASPAPRTTDLLVRAPGIVLVPAEGGSPGMPQYFVHLRGSGGGGTGGTCAPALYIDGVRTRQGAGPSVDELLDPAMLEGVEVYARAAVAPVQYRADTDCGVVLFWTRAHERGNDWSWKRLAAGGAGILLLIVLAVR
jgi:hypothetical protein